MEVDFGQYSDGLEFEFGSLGVVLPHHVAAEFRKGFAGKVGPGTMRESVWCVWCVCGVGNIEIQLTSCGLW